MYRNAFYVCKLVGKVWGRSEGFLGLVICRLKIKMQRPYTHQNPKAHATGKFVIVA